jgi:hypothetical protein
MDYGLRRNDGGCFSVTVTVTWAGFATPLAKFFKDCDTPRQQTAGTEYFTSFGGGK